MKRRPHWDDDLVYAVIHEIGVLRPSPHSLRDTAYAVIAAVEDWMDANDNPLPHVLNECLQWLDAERAAIARVRQLHYGYDAMDGLRRCGCCGHPWPCLTAQALNGDKCPTCEGPIRETVGLVCQTCGTDYGAQGDSDE